MSEERVNLRDFQEALADKVDRANAGDKSPAMLGIESGGERWLVDLAEAGEVLPLPVPTAVPLTRPWFVGLVNIRGSLYGVTDLSAFHGGELTPLKSQSRLLLIGSRIGTNTALLIAHTHGLKTVSAMEAMPAESAATGRQPWRGVRYRDGDGRWWTQLVLPALLSAPDFLDIAA